MTSTAKAFRQLEDDAKLLEKISQSYPPTSPEFHALRRAAIALTYAVMHDREKFAMFAEEMDRELSTEERNQLKDRYGIET